MAPKPKTVSTSSSSGAALQPANHKSMHKSNKTGKSGKSGTSAKSGKSVKSGTSVKSGKSGNLSRTDKIKKQKSTQVVSKEAKKPRTLIDLLCKGSVFSVEVEKLVGLSDLFKKARLANAVPQSVNLDECEKESVEILAKFIQDKKDINEISYFTLAELIKIANCLEMWSLLNQLEEYLKEAATTKGDAAPLMQSLLILSLTSVSPHAENIVFEAAASRFVHLAKLNNFQVLPFRIFSVLLGRCDLKVKTELEVVDVVLLWLAGHQRSSSYTAATFSFIRTHLLHPAEKAFVLDRARVLKFSSENISSVSRALRSDHGLRLCGHSRPLARCHKNPTHAAPLAAITMPLSFPRKEIFFREGSGKEGESAREGSSKRPTANERSMKDKSGQSTKSEGKSNKSVKFGKSKMEDKSGKSTKSGSHKIGHSAKSGKSKSEKSGKSTKSDAKSIKTLDKSSKSKMEDKFGKVGKSGKYKEKEDGKSGKSGQSGYSAKSASELAPKSQSKSVESKSKTKKSKK